MVNTLEHSKEASVTSVWIWEFIYALSVSLPFLTHGLAYSYLEDWKFDVFVSGEITWPQTGMLLAAAVSAPVFASIANKLGRKAGYFCISLVQGAMMIPMYLDLDLYFQILLGISAAGIFTVLPPYVREITSSKLRCVCLALTTVLMLCGVMARAIDYTSYAAVVRAYPVPVLVVIQMMLMMYVVESPGYLVMAGKEEKVKTALSLLKRLPENDPVIIQEISSLNDEINRCGDNGTITLMSLYRNKIVWDSIKMGFFLFTTTVLCGGLEFLRASRVLEMLDITLIIALLLIGGILTVFFVIIVDIKYILTVSYGLMAVSLGVCAVKWQFQFDAHLSVVGVARTVVSVFLYLLLVAYGMTWQLPGLFSVQLLNVKIRTPILAVMYTYSQLLLLLHAHTFKYLEDFVGIHTLFYVFAGINLYGGMYCLFVLPRTRNKELKAIEKEVKRIPLPA